MTLAVMALYADGPTHADATSPAGASRKPTASPPWPPSCASSAPRSTKAPTSSQSRRPRSWRAAQRSTPTTTTAWRCAFRWPRSTAWPARGRRCRCASSTRAASPRPSPTTSRPCSAWRAADAGDIPVITDRRPHRLGQGHAGRGAWPRAWATTCSTRARCTAPPRWPRMRAGVARRRRSRAWRALAARAATCASTAGQILLGGAGRHRRAAPRSRRRAWPRGSRPARGAPRAARRCSCRFAACPGLVADGRDMGTVVFPDATLKVFLTASAAQRAERRYKQLISKGISANIDSLRADLEARDAARPVAQRRASEAGRRCAVARQLGTHHRSNRCDAVLDSVGSSAGRSAEAIAPTAAGRRASPARQSATHVAIAATDQPAHHIPQFRRHQETLTCPKPKPPPPRPPESFAALFEESLQTRRHARRRSHHRRSRAHRAQLRGRQRRPQERGLRSDRRIQERPGRARSPGRRLRLGGHRRASKTATATPSCRATRPSAWPRGCRSRTRSNRANSSPARSTARSRAA